MSNPSHTPEFISINGIRVPIAFPKNFNDFVYTRVLRKLAKKRLEQNEGLGNGELQPGTNGHHNGDGSNQAYADPRQHPNQFAQSSQFTMLQMNPQNVSMNSCRMYADPQQFFNQYAHLSQSTMMQMNRQNVSMNSEDLQNDTSGGNNAQYSYQTCSGPSQNFYQYPHGRSIYKFYFPIEPAWDYSEEDGEEETTNLGIDLENVQIVAASHGSSEVVHTSNDKDENRSLTSTSDPCSSSKIDTKSDKLEMCQQTVSPTVQHIATSSTVQLENDADSTHEQNIQQKEEVEDYNIQNKKSSSPQMIQTPSANSNKMSKKNKKVKKNKNQPNEKKNMETMAAATEQNNTPEVSTDHVHKMSETPGTNGNALEALPANESETSEEIVADKQENNVVVKESPAKKTKSSKLSKSEKKKQKKLTKQAEEDAEDEFIREAMERDEKEMEELEPVKQKLFRYSEYEDIRRRDFFCLQKNLEGSMMEDRTISEKILIYWCYEDFYRCGVIKSPKEEEFIDKRLNFLKNSKRKDETKKIQMYKAMQMIHNSIITSDLIFLAKEMKENVQFESLESDYSKMIWEFDDIPKNIGFTTITVQDFKTNECLLKKPQLQHFVEYLNRQKRLRNQDASNEDIQCLDPIEKEFYKQSMKTNWVSVAWNRHNTARVILERRKNFANYLNSEVPGYYAFLSTVSSSIIEHDMYYLTMKIMGVMNTKWLIKKGVVHVKNDLSCQLDVDYLNTIFGVHIKL